MLNIKFTELDCSPSLALSESLHHFESILDSIEKNGQLTPVLVKPSEKGYTLIDGYLRVKAMRQLGQTECAAIQVDPKSEGETLVLAITSNRGRDWEPIDFFNAANKLREVYPLQKGKRTDLTLDSPYGSTAEIAKLLGKSERVLQRILRVGNFSTALIAETSEGGSVSITEAEKIVSRLDSRGLENPSMSAIHKELERLEMENAIAERDQNAEPQAKGHRCPSKPIELSQRPITPYCNACPHYQELFGGLNAAA